MAYSARGRSRRAYPTKNRARPPNIAAITGRSPARSISRPNGGETSHVRPWMTIHRTSIVVTGVPYRRTRRNPAKAMKICLRQPSRKLSR